MVNKFVKQGFFIFFFTLLFQVVWGQLYGNTFTLHSVSSNVMFHVEELGKGHVSGHFSQLSGSLTTSGNTMSVHGAVFADSINTGSKLRDSHLKSKVFFYEKKYPEISFDGILLSDNMLDGHLKIKDKIVPLQFQLTEPVYMVQPTKSIHVVSEFEVNRQDLGLKAYGKMIKNKVSVTVDLIFESNARKN